MLCFLSRSAESHRGQAQQAGVCSPACDECRWSNLLELNKGFWWFGITKSWNSPAALWPLYYIHQFGCPFAFRAASVLCGTLHIPVIRWQSFCTFVLMGFSNCTTSKKGWENCGKKDLHSQQPHSTTLLILRGPKMCQGNIPCTMTPLGGWEGSMRSCCSC